MLNQDSQRVSSFRDAIAKSPSIPLEGISKHFTMKEATSHLDSSRHLLPPMKVTPSRAPFQRRQASLSEAIEQHRAVQKVNQQLSPDDKNFRV